MVKLEKIEKDIIKELTELSKTQQLNEEFYKSRLTKKIHFKYLELLEKKAINLHPPMTGYLGVDYLEKNAEYVRLRNIVLSVFALIESKINYLLNIKLNRSFVNFPKPNDGITEALNILLDEKNYSAKVDALEKLYRDEKIDIGFLYDFGRIRNAFAHALRIEDKKYKFSNRNVADNNYAFDDFIEKAFEIKNKLEAIAKEQPEVKALNKLIKVTLHNLAQISAAQKKES